MDYAVYFTFYQTPSVSRAFLYFGDAAEKDGARYVGVPYGANGVFDDVSSYTPIFEADQSGVYSDPSTGERHSLYVYVNGSAVFLRSSKLVCIFVECGEACEDTQEDDLMNCRSLGTCKIEPATVFKPEGSDSFAAVTSKAQWYDTLEFGCKMPALANGQVRVSFSNNKFLGGDHALELRNGDGEDRMVSYTSLPCVPGQFAPNTAAPCADCPVGTYDGEGGLGTSCTWGRERREQALKPAQ